MIIYGSKAVHLKTQDIPGQCKNCSTSNSLRLSAFQKYAHVFWIPLFPLGKELVTECGHCKQVLRENEVRDAYRIPYQDFKQQLTVPIWTFSGLGLIGLLILTTSISGYYKGKEYLTMVQSPAIGDVYKYKTDDGQYSLLKVSEIFGDTVYVFQNNYAATKIAGLTKLITLGDSSYDEEPYPLLKSELAKMVETDEILEVVR
jgi:hypothetical protein